MSTYSQVENHLLETYAGDNVVAEVDNDIFHFTLLKKSTVLHFSGRALDEGATLSTNSGWVCAQMHIY